ncbi:hypothetical protein QQP08_027023 [Theobroma cacao]|nr:hypothetical protein QQP08_027023 [Theobroma cacao]
MDDNANGARVQNQSMIVEPSYKRLLGCDFKNPSMGQPSVDSIYGDSGVGYSTKCPAEETEVQMLASTGDPMLP